MKAHAILPSRFEPTEAPRTFIGPNGERLIVEVENSLRGLFWRLIVDGETGPVCQYYDGIYEFKGWCLKTAYWDAATEFTPFRMVYAAEVPK